jgi:hypothetical protein
MNKMTQVQLPVILRIFEENLNPVDMHTSIMCINILQNIKAVAIVLYIVKLCKPKTSLTGKTRQILQSHLLNISLI